MEIGNRLSINIYRRPALLVHYQIVSPLHSPHGPPLLHSTINTLIAIQIQRR